MKTLVRAGAATAAALIAILATALGASADVSGHIVQIQQSGAQLRLVFSASGLAQGVSIDTTSVQVTLDGTAVPVKTQPLTAAGIDLNRTAVLAIDTSGSMQGAGISGARAAAQQFLRSVPADVRVGVVRFSARPAVLVRPTTNHATVSAAISHLAASGETALYDGVSTALRLEGSSGPRTLVVLSDGADTTSRQSLAAVERQVKASKVQVDAVAFRTNASQSNVLRQIAAAGGGRLIASAQSSDLSSAFQQAARDIAGEVLVTATLPASTQPGATNVAITAKAGATTLSDTAFASLQAVKAPTPQSLGARPVSLSKIPTGVFVAGVIALFVGAAILLAFAFASWGGGSESNLGRRFSIYTLTGRSARRKREATALGDSELAHSAVDLAGRVVASRGLEEVLTLKLEAAGIPLKPSEWLLLHVGIIVVLPPFLLILTGGNLLFAVIGAFIGAAGPWLYLSFKESRRRTAFMQALPDTLQLIAGGLQAGYSLPQALDSVVREGTEPVAGEFNRALIETRLGVTIEDALGGIAERIGSTDFGWVVMAIRIQREVGGNLAEVLTNVAATLRERERLRRQVQVLSAEGRLSAWILGSLPVLFALYLSLVRRDYIKLLVTDPIGYVLLIVLGVAMTVGVFWLRKVVQVEV
jgi:tight adherence protein B